MQRKKLMVAAGIAAFSLSGIALAAPAIDTLLTEGYDSENTTLVFGVSPVDAEGTPSEEATLDCSLEGTFDYVLAEPEEVTESTEPVVEEDDESGKPEVEVVEVTELTEGGESVTFGSESGDADPVEYGSDEAAECFLSAIDVTGPNGQVNHGTIVSSFVHALKASGMKGIGCLVKTIAGSDYGKGDQQVQAGAEEEVVEPPAEETTASMELSSTGTACDHGKPDDAGKPEGKGKPEGAGRPEGTGKPEGKGKPTD